MGILRSADTQESRTTYRMQDLQFTAGIRNTLRKWHRPRDVYPPVANIRPASSYIWVGGCTPEINSDEDYRENL